MLKYDLDYGFKGLSLGKLKQGGEEGEMKPKGRGGGNETQGEWGGGGIYKLGFIGILTVLDKWDYIWSETLLKVNKRTFTIKQFSDFLVSNLDLFFNVFKQIFFFKHFPQGGGG